MQLKVLRQPELDIAHLEDVLLLRGIDYEQCLLAHLRGYASEEILRKTAAGYREALQKCREARTILDL